MTNGADWVTDARDHLGMGVVDTVNRLGEAYTPGDGTLTFDFEPKGIIQGTPLCAGLNTFLAWSVNPGSKTVEVTGGYEGGADAALPLGTLVHIRPAVFTHRIFRAINDTLNELSSPTMGVSGIGETIVDLLPTSTRTVFALDVPPDLQKVLRVQVANPTSSIDRWRTLRDHEYQVVIGEPSAQFPAGNQLRLNCSWGDATEARVLYAHTLTGLDDLSSDVTQTGLPVEAWDLPALGAASRLAMATEFARNRTNAQPDTRRAGEVPAGAKLGGARALRAMYLERVNAEAARQLGLRAPKRGM